MWAAHPASAVQDNNKHTQHVLQGHTAAITCVRASEDTSLVVTADTGPESMIVVWNTETAQPRITIPQPHSNGTLAIDLSLEGNMLVTLSNPDAEEGLQEIALWDLSSASPSTSTIRIPIPAGDLQVCLTGWHPGLLCTCVRRQLTRQDLEARSSGRPQLNWRRPCERVMSGSSSRRA